MVRKLLYALDARFPNLSFFKLALQPACIFFFAARVLPSESQRDPADRDKACPKLAVKFFLLTVTFDSLLHVSFHEDSW